MRWGQSTKLRMKILGIHPGYHDACAALFDDYTMVAAVAQERMTRRKSDGGRIPRGSGR